MAIVRLKKDLSKYRFGFTFGAVCEADLNNPIKHPKITWEKVYNLKMGSRELSVGRSAFDILGDDDTAAQAFLLNEKSEVIATLDKSALVVIYEQKGKAKLYDAVNRSTIKSVFDCGPKMVSERCIHAPFVWEYVQEAEKPHLVLHYNYASIRAGEMLKYEYFTYKDGKQNVEKGMVTIHESWSSSGIMEFVKHFMERKLHEQRKKGV